MTIQIPLTQGMVALIDDEDFGQVSQFKWCASKRINGRFYARRKANHKFIYLHRFLMDAPHDMEVDHIDGDGLNCQRYNMRQATHANNLKNRRRHSNNTSGSKGVSFKVSAGKYISGILANGVHHYLGLYSDPVEAARAYDAAARKLHGDFATLNFP